jgi:hypothetical protein
VVIHPWVVHRLSNRSDRAQALDKMARVLRSCGWLLLADIERYAEYVAYLNGLGFVDIRHVVSPFWGKVRGFVTFGALVQVQSWAKHPPQSPSSGQSAINAQLRLPKKRASHSGAAMIHTNMLVGYADHPTPFSHQEYIVSLFHRRQ